MDISPIRGLVLFVFFIIVNFIMYSFGEASQNVNESDVKDKAEEGDKASIKLLKIIDKPKSFVVTIQLMATAFAMGIGYFQIESLGKTVIKLAENIMGNRIDMIAKVAIYAIVTIIILILLIAIGIIVPQRIGRKNSEKVSYKFIGFVNCLMVVMKPFTSVISAVAWLVLKLFGVDYNDDTENVTEEEIISIVNEGHEQGILEEREAEMISNIIELDEKVAANIMTHRKNIIAIDGDWTLANTVEFIINENNSRFPVFVDDIDNIIGILHFRDAFTLYKKGNVKDKPIKELTEILREPKFIPETRCVDDLFRDMQKEKSHMEIIIDEYGQTSGIITMEDILEEIVGNIMDEYDEEENNIVKESESTYIIKGITPLEDIEDMLDVSFNEEDYDTLNGYLINRLDRIPSEDDNIVVETDGFKFEVLLIEGKMISLVKMTILKKDSKDIVTEG